MYELVMTPGTLDLARPLIARATAADRTSPVSDQAILAAQQGQRELFVFTGDVGAQSKGAADRESTAERESTADRESTAERESADAVVAVGIIGEGELDLVVDPNVRGRGIGRAALAELVAHAGTDAVLAWAHGDNPAADTILSAQGFVPVRSLFKMELDPAKLPAATDPLRVEFPEGFTLARFEAAAPANASLTDAERWVRANAAAFATHPEQGRITVADFALMRQEPWFDASDLMLLGAPGTTDLAGYTWVKTVREPSGAIETELYAIGVDPRFAGQGLGRGLLDATLARMAAHGPARVSLYVDGENARAVQMYERAGFEVATKSQQWRREANPTN